ncbi:hypothetical protein DFAR_1790002 [Desulfarculales bacterium]
MIVESDGGLDGLGHQRGARAMSKRTGRVCIHQVIMSHLSEGPPQVDYRNTSSQPRNSAQA